MQLDLKTAELPFRASGRVESVRHSAPQDRIWRLLHHKRWIYCSVATDDLFFAGSIVDLGYLAKGFMYLADRNDGRMRFHHAQLWPRAKVSARYAVFRSPLLTLRVQRHEEQTLFTGRARDLRVQVGFQERAPAMLAATMLGGGATHVTEKTLAMDAAGDIGNETIRGAGAVDFSDGYVPRHTRWKWANFSTIEAALNLTQGFVGTPECFAVVGGKHVPLGDAHITRSEDPMQPWDVQTACGKVALRFTPFALHADHTDLKVIHAKFSQPIGVFNGSVAGARVQDAIGVCEDQDVLW